MFGMACGYQLHTPHSGIWSNGGDEETRGVCVCASTEPGMRRRTQHVRWTARRPCLFILLEWCGSFGTTTCCRGGWRLRHRKRVWPTDRWLPYLRQNNCVTLRKGCGSGRPQRTFKRFMPLLQILYQTGLYPLPMKRTGAYHYTMLLRWGRLCRLSKLCVRWIRTPLLYKINLG